METSLRRFAVLGDETMEENKASESNGDDESSKDEIVLQVGGGKRAHEYDEEELKRSPQHWKNTDSINKEQTTKVEKSTSEYESGSSSSAKKEQTLQLGEQLESTKAEIDQVMEENERLKTYLDRVMKDYRTLQMRYREQVLHQQAKIITPNTHHDQREEEPAGFVALSLGRTSSGTKVKNEILRAATVQEVDNESLKLGLDCKVTKVPEVTHVEISPDPSPEHSIEEVKDDGKDTSSPSKTGKNERDGGDEDISLHNPAKRARVSVRVRCDTPSMNDGCQWRKYGQKIAKGNPCPRAYYRCTVAPSCPVRKQVQRCAEDMSILITTYEGTHNHPLPISATAMASTTAAAASMLLSGSSTSAAGSSTSATTANINGLNFYLSDISRPRSMYLSDSSISSSSSFPTITLDLTSHSSSSSSNLTRLASYPPRYSTTNLNFSSLESNSLPISWSNGVLTSYGSQQPFNKNQTPNSFTFGAPKPHENLYQSYLQKNINQQQPLAPDTIAAATKAITTDPNFQSALAAALSSLIGSAAASTSTQGNANIGDKFPILSSFPSATNNGDKCASSFGNMSTSSSSAQPGSLMFRPPSFPFANTKSKSNSPGDN